MTAPEPSSAPPLSRLFRIAASVGIESAIRLHIGRGDDLEARDETGLTPLLIAASRNRVSICGLLLDAGASPHAIDPSGRDALSIAEAAGASETAGVIRAHLSRTSAGDPQVDNTGPERRRDAIAEHKDGDCAEEQRCELQCDDRRRAGARSDSIPDEDAVSPGIHPLGGAVRLHGDSPASPGNSGRSNYEEDDLGAWEPAGIRPAPAHDPAVALSARALQRTRDVQVPAAAGASWDDVEISLPEEALPPRQNSDPVHNERLRALILRAIREGSVPQALVENALSLHADGQLRDEAAEKAFGFLIGDLGAETDERIEMWSSHPTENSEVHVNNAESESEERQVDEALHHFQQVYVDANDSLRFYLKAARNRPLLTKEDEVRLASGMDMAAENALDALVAWDAGIAFLLDTLEGARSDATLLGRMLVLQTTDIDQQELADDGAGPDVEPEQDDKVTGAQDEAPATLQGSSQPEDADPLEALDRVLAGRSYHGGRAGSHSLRDDLRCMRLRRPFLMSIADLCEDEDSNGARSFRPAIKRLVALRSEMADGNVRLVIDLARRHLRTGATIEDLIQDGNVGLLAAIDRYDWRRGFRFSTMATWWIRQSLSRSVQDRHLLIRLPAYLHQQVARDRREAEAHVQISTDGLVTSKAGRTSEALMPWKIEAATRAFSVPLSMEDAEAAGLLPEDPTGDPFESYAAKEIAGLVASNLQPLGRKPEAILRMRYGIGLSEPHTLEEVGRSMELTRERIRQIESKSLKRLAPLLQLMGVAHGSRPDDGDKIETPNPDPERTGSPDVVAGVDLVKRRKAAPAAAAPHIEVNEKSGKVNWFFDGNDEDQIRFLIRRAWELGIPVSTRVGSSGRRYTFQVSEPYSDEAGRLVRHLVERGFSLHHGEGYSN